MNLVLADFSKYKFYFDDNEFSATSLSSFISRMSASSF
jgi:hypothetical protein